MILCSQVLVVCLVILDAIFVLAELLIDLSVIKLEHGHVAPQVRRTAPSDSTPSKQDLSLYRVCDVTGFTVNNYT